MEIILSIDKNLAELLADLNLFDDWLDKYQYIIDLGKSLPEFPQDLMIDANLVEGCQSRVWLTLNCEAGKINFAATSDAAIVKGLIGVINRLYQGAKQTDLQQRDPQADLEKLGLTKHLSMTRKNGLFAMVNKIFAHH